MYHPLSCTEHETGSLFGSPSSILKYVSWSKSVESFEDLVKSWWDSLINDGWEALAFSLQTLQPVIILLIIPAEKSEDDIVLKSG